MDRRNWSVGSNRVKHLIPDTEAWREEGHCKLCKVSMDSYDHLYRECPGEDLHRARTLRIAAIKENGRNSPIEKEHWHKDWTDIEWHWETSRGSRNNASE